MITIFALLILQCILFYFRIRPPVITIFALLILQCILFYFRIRPPVMMIFTLLIVVYMTKNGINTFVYIFFNQTFHMLVL